MSLRVKMIIGICLIFACLLAAMNGFISENIQTNNEQIITGDLLEMTSNGQIYARQFLALSDRPGDSAGFEAVAKDTVRELAGVSGNPTGAYSPAGKLLYASREGAFDAMGSDDLEAAKRGDSAFTLDTRDGRTTACFSYPITVDGADIGIIRTVADYTALYDYGNGMMHSVTVLTAVMFLIALIISIFFIQNVSSPVIKLAAISGTVAKGIELGTLSVSSIESLLATRRKDEIGRLSRNFVDMIRKIDQQMHVIDADRQELRRLADYRKEFYDTVTHELKNPLTAIGGYASVLEENGFTDREFFDKGIYHIRQESDRMYRLVVALLEMSKLASPVNDPKQVLELNELVEESCDAMGFKAEKYQTRIVCAQAPRLRIFGSPVRLKEVFVNLLDNAIKYKKPGGDVHVVIREKGTIAQVSVINSADPIPEDEMPRLFEPFYRTSQTQAGAEGSCGLGLSICRQIIDQHAGTIVMRSLPGGNVAVVVDLPAYTGL